MRWMLLACLVACGGDHVGSIEESLGDAGGVDPDASVTGDAATLADAPPLDGPGDGPPATLCEEAALHSDLAWIEANVFVPQCSSCHGGAEPDAGLRLTAGQSHHSLVNVVSSTKGTPWVRVKPGSVADSYLMVALDRTPGPPSSLGFMPLGAPPLCTQMLEAIERWIIAGAAQ